MEQELEIQKPAQKIYKDREIWVGTFLGGPLAAGYLIAENFKAFNEEEKAKKTWIIAIIATVLIFGGVFLIPDDVNIPNQLIPLIYTGIAYFLVQHFQGENIMAHIKSGGQLFGWWRTILVGVISLAIILIPIFAFVYLSNPTSINATTKTYGNLKHQILYNESNITDNEINQIADGLTKTTFFDEAQQKTVFVKKEDKKYIIIIPVVDDAWNNVNAIGFFDQLRKDMQSQFPNNKIAIDLGTDLENVKKRIE